MTDLSEQKIETMKDLLKVQLSNGNWDYDAYMHGMANGMIIMYGVASGIQPEFKTSPAYYKSKIAQFSRWLYYLKNPIFFTFVYSCVKILEQVSNLDLSNGWFGSYQDLRHSKAISE